MVSPALRNVRYVICPSSNHAEVGLGFEFTPDKPLITCPGYMLSRGKISRLPPASPFLYSFSSPSGRIFWSVLRYGLVRYPLLALKMISRIILIPTAVALPDLHLDEFRTCFFEPWRTGEMIYTALSVVYGALFAAVWHTYPRS